jgi:hypothetical protein
VRGFDGELGAVDADVVGDPIEVLDASVTERC